MHRRTATARRLPRLFAPLALLGLLSLAAPPPRPASADAAYQPLPFAQDWSDAGLIGADNSWASVPGIVGYGGAGLVDTTSANPRALLADGSGTPAVVKANQSDPNALAPAGIAEFPGVVALAGDPTNVAPHLVLHLDTRGFQNIVVQYTLRDIETSSDSNTQPFTLQYRVGASGAFTDFPGNNAYLADATADPGQPLRVTPINVTLPAAADNQAQLQLRILTTNASQTDEWIGVDDISVAGTPIGAPPDLAPFIESTSPINGATGVVAETNIAITFSEPVTAAADAVTLSCGGAAVPFAGLPVAVGAAQIVLDPTAPLPAGRCDVTVLAQKVADVDGAPNPLSSNNAFGFTVSGSVCPADVTPTKISAVQGAGASTPLPSTSVTVQGVVTAVFGGLNGFFLQEEAADEDGDPATSEGIFVFAGGVTPGNTGLPAGAGVGDVVRVRGTPGESGAMTRIAPLDVADCGSSAAITPVDLSLPLAAQADLERYEGMLLRLPQELTISEHFNFDRFGQYTLARPRDGEARLYQPTTRVEPGPAAQALAQENLLRQIIVDDGRDAANPDPATHPGGQPFTLQNRFRSGDTVTGLTGVLAQQGSYRVHPTAPGVYKAENLRPVASAPVGGTLRVGSMNALNYFLTPNYPDDQQSPLDNTCGPQQNQECRGHDADQPAELGRQRAKLVAAIRLLDPDILGLIEIENTPGVDPLADLVGALNAGLGAADPARFAAVDTGVVGSDAIRVGLIYRPARVEPVGAFKWLTAAVDARFRDDKNRPVLAQAFRELSSGEKLTVAVAHLKSKGSSCNDVNDLDAGDGQGNCNLTRRDAARALVDWLAGDPTGSGDPDALIVGDLNSYALEDPIDAVLAGPDDDPGAAADNYTDLIRKYNGFVAYSYIFDGQVGYLDHALASASLAPQATGANEPHINADEPDLLSYDTSFKAAAQDELYAPDAYRAADHDPIIVGLDLGTDDPDPVPGPPPVDPQDPDPTPPTDPVDPRTPRLWLPLLRR